MQMEKKIAIVGTAPSASRAPYDDPSWEIWGCSLKHPWFKRADRWYELHRLDGEDKEWAEGWRKEMRSWQLQCPLYMIWPERDLSDDVRQLDYAGVMKRHGSYFLTSTIAWMFADAIDAEATHIGVWGVDMEYGTEYEEQRQGIRHFIETARHYLKIAVTLVTDGGLVYTPVPYPFWQDDPLMAKLHLRKIAGQEELMHAEKSLRECAVKYHETRGRLMETDKEERAAALSKELDQLDSMHKDAIRRVATINGSMEEQRWLRAYLMT